ncbi:hypothetical protein HHI36_007703 [Cryptolaemus montrouzieri]|uniref:RecA family profile 1 domain-containing protein n=1 Tax=Cryptolaemus montrouzieri TaxID=559131 RepID=A0ABD2MQU4_9CUCU
MKTLRACHLMDLRMRIFPLCLKKLPLSCFRMDRLKLDTHPLLNESVIAALNREKIFTAKDFILCDSQKLAKISLLVFKEILVLKKYLTKKYAAISKNAYDQYKDSIINSAIIPSGIQSIDEFLEGGLLTSNIYEICGQAASGKTLFAYTFIKFIVLEMKQNCFYLDTKNDFSAEKLSLLCREYSKDDISKGLSKIFIQSIETKYDLLNGLQELVHKLENNFCIRMIIIDSLAAVILNNSKISENNLILSHLARLMHFIATKYHVVFLVTNLVTSWMEGDFSAQLGSKTTIACGKYWYTVPNTRINLKIDKSSLILHIERSNVLSSRSITVPFKDIVSNVC